MKRISPFKIFSVMSLFMSWASQAFADGKISIRELTKLGEMIAREFNLPIEWDVPETMAPDEPPSINDARQRY